METSGNISNFFSAVTLGLTGFPVKAQLYMATCTGLDAWSKRVGFTTRHISLACDTDARISAMRASRYGSISLGNSVEAPYRHDEGWDDWRLLPFDPSDEHSPEFPLESGTLQVTSPVLPMDILSRRLLMMLAPLEASRCSNLPSAVAAQAFAKSKHHEVSRPRYTRISTGKYAVVRDIYFYNNRMTDVLSAALYGVLNAHIDGHAASSIGMALDVAVNGNEYVSASDLLA